jgi:hypothetical protein
MGDPHKSHKRQKSSSLNLNYYFPPPKELPHASQHTPSPTHASSPPAEHFLSEPFADPFGHPHAIGAYAFPSGATPTRLAQSDQLVHPLPAFQPYQYAYPDALQFGRPAMAQPQTHALATRSAYRGSPERQSGDGPGPGRPGPGGPAEIDFAKTDFYNSASPVRSRRPPQHAKNNLSISLHFNLFHLKEEYEPSVRLQPNPPPEAYQTLLPAANVYNYAPGGPVAPAALGKSILALLVQFPSIDGQNINSFLLQIIHRIMNQLPLDDFYNILYNSDETLPAVPPAVPLLLRIDRTEYVLPAVTASSSHTVLLVLGVFKDPALLTDYLPNFDTLRVKLSSVNYHELLRTFLAIKVLLDILVQLEDPALELDHTLPRLSIYKTYYIICQKLINTYPSASNTVGEQQKIILGQLKLGKLIKLVYPNLKIKRLGSRGESKYNYLGVMWNNHVVSDEIRQLCEKHELGALGDYYTLKKARKAKRKASGQHPAAAVTTDAAAEAPPEPTGGGGAPLPPPRRPASSLFAPQLSFTTPFLKFPTFADFLLVLAPPQESWFDSIAKEQFAVVDCLGGSLANAVGGLLEELTAPADGAPDSLFLARFSSGITSHYAALAARSAHHVANLDLRIYTAMILELVPHLLLLSRAPVAGYSSHSAFLQTLRSSLIYFVDNYADTLGGLEHTFGATHATIFCVMLKKLINVNDLLITFIKLIMHEEGFGSTRSSMKLDIQNYLISPSPSLLFENNEIRFNFKEDIVQNDLIFSLLGYNYNPLDSGAVAAAPQPPPPPPQGTATGQDTERAGGSVVSMKFVREEATLSEQFFKVDLVDFLSAKHDDDVAPAQTGWTNLLTPQEAETLRALIRLMHEGLLSTHFKSRYPILVYHNFISCILNDLLKHIYSKQQVQLQLQLQSSFGNWWVFNSFVEEYVGLMGEIVGLHHTIQQYH